MYEEVVRASPSPLLKVLVLFSSRGNAAFPLPFFFFFFMVRLQKGMKNSVQVGDLEKKQRKQTNKNKKQNYAEVESVQTCVKQTF